MGQYLGGKIDFKYAISRKEIATPSFPEKNPNLHLLNRYSWGIAE